MHFERNFSTFPVGKPKHIHLGNVSNVRHGYTYQSWFVNPFEGTFATFAWIHPFEGTFATLIRNVRMDEQTNHGSFIHLKEHSQR